MAKSVSRVPTAITTSASRAISFAPGLPSSPSPPSPNQASLGHRALAGERLDDRDPERLGERRRARPRPPSSARRRRRRSAAASPSRSSSTASAIRAAVRRRPLDPPGARLEEALGEVVRVRLHVLRQRDHDRARLDRAREHAHRLGQRGQQLLGPRDPVEEAATGRKQSLTVTSPPDGCSSCWSTGPWCRVA